MKYAILIIVGIGLIWYSVQKRPDPVRDVVQARFISPPKDLVHFTLGYYESVSDSLWLRLIQDIDYCENKDEKSDGRFSCNKGWVFQMLDRITELTPRFRIPFIVGATLLSVVVNDTAGATEIFARGLKQFPNDWSLAYRAAYHHMNELHDSKGAADLMVIAAKNGAPSWTYALAAKLYTQEGQAFLAKSILEDVLANNPKERFNERLRARLDEANRILEKAKSDPAFDPNPGSGPAATPDHH